MIDDVTLLENEDIIKDMRFPYKIDKVIQLVITSGRFSCVVDFCTYSLDAPVMEYSYPVR